MTRSILWSILFTGLNTTYILAYHFGMYQISRDLWTLTLWLFGQKNRRTIIMTAHTYIHTEREFTHHRTKMEYFGLYSKTVYESNFGRFAFWIFVTRTNNNVACLIFFKCEWQRGSPPIWFGLAHTKKWTFTKWKHRAHSSIIKQPLRNKMKPRKICMRLANKLEMVACHSCYIGSYSKVSQRWKSTVLLWIKWKC